MLVRVRNGICHLQSASKVARLEQAVCGTREHFVTARVTWVGGKPIGHLLWRLLLQFSRRDDERDGGVEGSENSTFLSVAHLAGFGGFTPQKNVDACQNRSSSDPVRDCLLSFAIAYGANDDGDPRHRHRRANYDNPPKALPCRGAARQHAHFYASVIEQVEFVVRSREMVPLGVVVPPNP
jgi:hypothetical protein